MNESELRQQIFEILHRVAPEANLERIDPNENLREALDIDSFDFLQIVIAFHDKFKVNIPESDYRHIATLKGLLGYLAAASKAAE